ncbi:MAG: diiron oxygenase [Polyangiaceae bacterium]
MLTSTTQGTQNGSGRTAAQRYRKAIEASKRARWEMERDVIRGRELDPSKSWLPPGLSMAQRLDFLTPEQQCFFSQVQGRTYAYIFGLVERFINAKVLELSSRHVLGDQIALEALVRFSDEELKHQELFRRVEALADGVLPPGYVQTASADDVARAVLGMSTWAVLALTLHIELFTQTHYKQSIDPGADICPLFRDVFKFHWMEESQHAVIDEIEFRAEHERMSGAERDQGVSDFIALVAAVDGLVVTQATADAEYFCANVAPLTEAQRAMVGETFVRAYRYQYILSGVAETKLVSVLGELATPAQMDRVAGALASLQ